MKRPVGLSVLAVLFSLWGLSGLRAALSGETSVLDRLPRLVVSVLILATAYGLYRVRTWTLKVYVTWVGFALLIGLASELSLGTPLPVVVLGGGLVTAVWGTVGVYIATNMPDAA